MIAWVPVMKVMLANAWRFLRAIPWPVWLALALIAGALYYGHTRYEAGEAAGKSQVQADFDAYRAEMVRLQAAAEQKARDQEAAQRSAFAAIDQRYQEKTRVAVKDATDRLLTDIASGRVRVRDIWRSCPTSPGVPSTPDGAALADGASDVREAGIGRILGIARACDAQVAELQAILRAERGQ